MSLVDRARGNTQRDPVSKKRTTHPGLKAEVVSERWAVN